MAILNNFPPARPAPPPVSTPDRDERPRRLSSQALLGEGAEVHIVHGEHVYRLRRTALGKLILTK